MKTIKEKYSARQVFVPGGLPTHTYNPRVKLELEDRLEDAKDNLCKLVMITGSTKSGKTVLTNKIFPRDECIWFDGGAFSNENDFWVEIAQQLDVFPDVSKTDSKEKGNQLSASGTVEKQLLLFKFKGEGKATRQRKRTSLNALSRKGNPKTLAIQALGEKNIPLIIDDFHYIPRDIQGTIVRAVKSLIFNGLPVIFIAIPHRRLDAVKVEKEMTGRIETIDVPVWNADELVEIPNIGFPLLNIKLDGSIINNFAEQSIGSPHLMQELCRELCTIVDIRETQADSLVINSDSIEIEKLFRKVALNTGKIIFDKLSRGPRQRADRVQRTLVNGANTDIYGLVLFALAYLKPNLDSIEYEVLRSAIKDVSHGTQPQAHEVTRVLDKMSQIASSDESSTPVIDWDKEERILHVTDPFFAYYLRWGLEYALSTIE